MATKMRKKSDGPTGITLFFEGTKLRATLVKFDKVRYRKVADIVECAFKRAFGDGFTHKRGTREWAKDGAAPDQADTVAMHLSNYPEVLSVTYDQSDRPGPMFKTAAMAGVKKLRRETRANKAAVDVLRRAVFGDGTLSIGIDGEIVDSEKRINNLSEELRRAQNGLEGLKAKRAQLMETIRSLGGSTL